MLKIYRFYIMYAVLPPHTVPTVAKGEKLLGEKSS